MYFADSSVLNAPGSGSFGGHAMCYEGSGLMDWRCFVPRRLGDSSATAELIVATEACKAALGHRILFRELQVDQARPTLLLTDAQAAKNGAAMEKVSRNMKYMSARYAVLRQSEHAGATALTKAGTKANIADIFTKPLSALTHNKFAAFLIGHIQPALRLLIVNLTQLNKLRHKHL